MVFVFKGEAEVAMQPAGARFRFALDAATRLPPVVQSIIEDYALRSNFRPPEGENTLQSAQRTWEDFRVWFWEDLPDWARGLETVTASAVGVPKQKTLAAALWLGDGQLKANFLDVEVREKRVTHLVVVASTATQSPIASQWLVKLPELQSVIFVLPAVWCVGNLWLANCRALASACFAGMAGLQSVGSNWLAECTRLTAVSFEGMGLLETVDSAWMLRCQSLQSVSCVGLAGLEDVGHSWLCQCTALEKVNFLALSNIVSVGNNWLFGCVTL
jgi:hypothetical protein